MVKINGEILDVVGMKLSDYLEKNNYSLTRIAVEKNGEIVPKKLYDETIIKEYDVFEIVNFVGGG